MKFYQFLLLVTLILGAFLGAGCTQQEATQVQLAIQSGQYWQDGGLIYGMVVYQGRYYWGSAMPNASWIGVGPSTAEIVSRNIRILWEKGAVTLSWSQVPYAIKNYLAYQLSLPKPTIVFIALPMTALKALPAYNQAPQYNQ